MSYHSNADLGGSDEHGAIIQEPEGELFHAPWEPRVLALTLAMTATGLWNIDMNRAARETLANYRELSYYEIWLAALEKLLADSGALQRIRHRRRRECCAPSAVAAMLARGTPFERAPARAARFALGDRVRTARRSTCASHPLARLRARQNRRRRRECMGCMYSPIPTPAARASARNGCIQSRSTSANCGAMRPRSDPPYRWMPGNRTSNLP